MSSTEEGRWLEGQSQYGGSGGQPFTGASRDFIVTPMTGDDPMCVPESVQVPCPQCGCSVTIPNALAAIDALRGAE